MPSTDFLNVNRYRAYPFLVRTTAQPESGPLTLNQLPNDVIVDVGFIAGPRSLFDAAVHSIYLSRISRSSGVFTFEFSSDAAELSNAPLTFTRNVGDELNLTEHSDTGEDGFSLSGSAAEESAACDEPVWSGYLVTGDLSFLDTFLSGDGEILPGTVPVRVEPAVIVNLAASFITSLSTANADRTRVTGAENCDDVSWPYPVGDIFVNDRCIIGSVVVFKPGYNTVVRQNASNNALVIAALVGAGEGEPCTEQKILSIEEPPLGSSLLSGGPRCNEVLRSINGIGGPILQILSDLGANIIPLPDEHKLVIDMDMSGLATCFDSVSTVSESL